ncbi:Ectonucleotide pyrophosphatase/phosphodiesterase family member 3 [Trichoplax sp. H2]|nr:Ectonucleotide pyrophosphatase/phosphodiesterase family member 3 [Trichoplax sp. H2]|eukprot:RDD43637.1 Ectonucleotide pyrophosphatase/phosphodiesterase family member 3 [Trichoplax sp. H2]
MFNLLMLIIYIIKAITILKAVDDNYLDTTSRQTAARLITSSPTTSGNKMSEKRDKLTGDNTTFRGGNRRNVYVYVIGGIILVAAGFTIGILIGIFTQKAAFQGQQSSGTTAPPPSYVKSICNAKVKPLLLISVDGFRWDYHKRGFSPNLTAFGKATESRGRLPTLCVNQVYNYNLASRGVRADYMQSCFPTKTFPNHYSIVTGLYPAHHGIVANTFFDPQLNDKFYIGAKNSTQSKWWGGEPIWVTARKNNLKAASYFWVGSESEIKGYRPNYWYRYNGSIPFMERVHQVFRWLEMPESERPTMITLYFDQPDYAGHVYGPESSQVNEQIKRIDDTLGAIFMGLKKRGLENCVNIIVISDHGMRKTCCSRMIYLDQFINITTNDIINRGTFGGIRVKGGNATEIAEKLRCKSKFWRVYKKEDMPVRFHYDNNSRIPDVIILPNENWLVRPSYNPRYTFCNGANHGWDNLDTDMRTIFMAAGPGFKKAKVIKPFKNIELYNVMAALLGVKPAKNDGNMGRLNSILTNPVVVTDPNLGEAGKVCRVPTDQMVFDERANCSECVCPYCKATINVPLFNKGLIMTPKEELQSENRNFPWGIPRFRKSMDTCTLYQKHFITGYSNTYRVPIFTGYHLTDVETLRPLSRKDCFRRDIRLNIATQASNCSNYYRSGYNRGHLAPNGELSFDLEAQGNSFLLSNIAPQKYPFNAGPWLDLEKLSRDWAKIFGGVYIISGSIVKADPKTVWSDPSYWLKGEIGGVVIPTHFYKIIAKCRDSDQVLCNSSVITSSPCKGHLDVIAFVLPHIDSFTPQCQVYHSNLFHHVASVREIEKLTGLNFFPNMPIQLQDMIESDSPTDLWPTY